jgi:hypothetical protein
VRRSCSEGAELLPSVFYHWQRHLFEHGAAAFGESCKRADQLEKVTEEGPGAALRGASMTQAHSSMRGEAQASA